MGSEFIDDLAARAAGGRWLRRWRIDRHVADSGFTGRDRRKNGGSLGTIAESVGSVFDIASGVHPARRSDHRGADRKSGVGCVSLASCAAG